MISILALASSFMSQSSLTSNTFAELESDRTATPPVVLETDARSKMPLYFEDLCQDQEWISPLREITKQDVIDFSELTGDFDPLHDIAKGDSDGPSESAVSTSPFGRPVAHGLLGMSVLAGLGTEYPRAATLALVGVTNWQFEKPIFFGERVRVVTTIELIEPHGRRAGKITWLRKLVDQEGRVLQQGNFVTLVASKRRRPNQPR